jgi:hypothetical protein
LSHFEDFDNSLDQIPHINQLQNSQHPKAEEDQQVPRTNQVIGRVQQHLPGSHQLTAITSLSILNQLPTAPSLKFKMWMKCLLLWWVLLCLKGQIKSQVNKFFFQNNWKL